MREVAAHEPAAAPVVTNALPRGDEAANNAAGSYSNDSSADGGCEARPEGDGDRPGPLLDARTVAAATPSLQEHPAIAAEDVAFATRLGEVLPDMLRRRDSLVQLSRDTQHQVGLRLTLLVLAHSYSPMDVAWASLRLLYPHCDPAGRAFTGLSSACVEMCLLSLCRSQPYVPGWESLPTRSLQE